MKEEYLSKPEQYALVYRKGSSWSTNLLVMKTLANGLAISRYGFSVSRWVGNAVTRNRVKRLLRETLRQIPLAPGRDIIFIARRPVSEASFADIKQAVDSLLFRARLLVKENETFSLKAD